MNQIAKNIEARQDAESAWEFVTKLAEESVDEHHFWKCFCELYDDRFPVVIPPGTVQPMTDEESRAFESHIVEFGKWKDRMIREIPIGYLLWLDGQPDFRMKLKRYLASERIQREQG
ncbi:MAG: hypothetical protein ACPGLY_27170 [Rubripirellula sp.]